MSEILTNVPIKIITGPCQTSDRWGVDYLKSLATMQVTNPNGVQIQAIAGGRLCTIKSRTELNPTDRERSGMGIDFSVWEEFSKQVIQAIKNSEKPPPLPITRGGQWAEEIQNNTGGMPLAFEAMDWMHAMLMMGHMLPGTGTAWSPSVLTLGHSIQTLSEVVGDRGGTLGIKGPKFYPAALPRCIEDGPTLMEATWVGLGMYALGATQIPKEILLIERGRDVPNKGNWRNIPDHNSARLAKQMLQRKVNDAGLSSQTQISMAYDPSHTNGPKRVEFIVEDSINAAGQMDLNGEPLYEVILVESKEKKAPAPLSDAGQHISGEQIQDIIDGIARFRPIKGFKS